MLGKIILALEKKKVKCCDYGIDYWKVSYLFGTAVSLGDYILVDQKRTITSNLLKHEHGHQLQYKKYGFFYWFRVGIPSLCGNIFDRLFHKKWDRTKRIKWYYSQPWESEADKLGGVIRN